MELYFSCYFLINNLYSEYLKCFFIINPTLSFTPAATTTPNRTADTRTVSLPSDQHEAEKRILILQAAVKNKWKVGGFCSTNGHGVRTSHSSTNCNDKRNSHLNAATPASTDGPGKDINKGWNEWLM